MSTEVVMPQMGESIAEGTITKWLKKVGERVERDEPLFEISTDKVDAEIPSPAAGTLTEIKVLEGATVEVNTVVAVLDGDPASATPEAPAPKPAEEAPAKTEAAAPQTTAPPPPPAAEKPAAPPPAPVAPPPPPPVDAKPAQAPAPPPAPAPKKDG
ncbi:MAG TPA: biotin/lipoyl-containing protein, partial [Pyrinomonadaceae bacterium]|nr:biotin/lipoyl-containing protein [Pyrinomonadaceae bacterium]